MFAINHAATALIFNVNHDLSHAGPSALCRRVGACARWQRHVLRATSKLDTQLLAQLVQRLVARIVDGSDPLQVIGVGADSDR